MKFLDKKVNSVLLLNFNTTIGVNGDNTSNAIHSLQYGIQNILHTNIAAISVSVTLRSLLPLLCNFMGLYIICVIVFYFFVSDFNISYTIITAKWHQ